MKIRSGFVSNSSSSSFVVVLEKKPNSPEELKNVLFKDEKIVQYYDYSKTTEEVSQRVFNDIERFEKDPSILLEKIVDGLDKWGWRYEKYRLANGQTDWKKHDEDREQYINDVVIPGANKFIETYKNNFIFCVTYGDSGSEVLYECGNIFKNAIENIIINEH